MMGDLDDLRELQRRARKSELLIIQQKLSLLKNKGKCRQKFLQSKNASNKIKNSVMNISTLLVAILPWRTHPSLSRVESAH